MAKHKKHQAFLLVALLTFGLLYGCGGKNDKHFDKTSSREEDCEIYVFIAASLGNAMDQIKSDFEAKYPDITVTYNKDSSGKLMSQIEEGASCDVFFSAAQEKMNTLSKDGLIDETSRVDLVGNTLILIKGKETATDVTGLDSLNLAKSIALADASVPAGKYTRIALVKAGTFPFAPSNPAQLSTKDVSEGLGGVEISEQSNVSKVLTSVMEGACDVGTVYISGTYGVTDRIDVIEKVSHDLTGPIVYPAALINNEEATKAQKDAAKKFLEYLKSDAAKSVFDDYLFDTDFY